MKIPGVALLGAVLWAAVPLSAAERNGEENHHKPLPMDISVVINMFGFYSPAAVGDLIAGLAGFGHHHHGPGVHQHGPANGFNLNHLEVMFASAVDPFFKASAIAAFSPHGAEIETAEIETASLPAGLKIRGGKFFSDIGYLNSRHPHEWDFLDAPIGHRLILGGHGFNDLGLQFSWLPPLPFLLGIGAEAFQGGHLEPSFLTVASTNVREYDHPRLFAGWLKFGPSLGGGHGLLLVLGGAWGVHQEEHDGNGDGNPDHWLDGASVLGSASLVYKYRSGKAYGVGDLTVHGEYLYRHQDLELTRHDLVPGLTGKHLVKNQDGYFLLATVGFAPGWRLGGRWEQAGLVNTVRKANGQRSSYDPSWKATLMTDWSPSEFSRLRLQAAYGTYVHETDEEDAWEVALQWTVSLGAHPAHEF